METDERRSPTPSRPLHSLGSLLRVTDVTNGSERRVAWGEVGS